MVPATGYSLFWYNFLVDSAGGGAAAVAYVIFAMGEWTSLGEKF